MKGLVRTVGILVLLGVLGFVSYRVLIGGSTVSWNQRLTVIVDTPAGKVRDHSVVEITKTETLGPLVLPEARGVSSEVRGEAVAVEVLPGRWLFALLSGAAGSKGDADQLAYHAFRLGESREPGVDSYRAYVRDLRAQPLDTPAPIPPEAYPLLVTFDDLAQPQTVREVDPTDLAATFGPGVTLQGMTLEITRYGISKGKMEEILPWICDYRASHQRLNGKSGSIDATDESLSNWIGTSNFLRESCK